MRASQGPSQPGRVSAWTALTLGISISVAANVANTWYASPRQLAAWTAAGHHGPWHPSAGAMLGAAYFPVSLLLTVEVLARVKWPAGFWWSAMRYCGTGIVALVAAFISYLHMSELLARYAYPAGPAHVGPLSVDGLMLVAAVALMTFAKPATGPTTAHQHLPQASSSTAAAANGSQPGGRRAERENIARAALAQRDLTNEELAEILGVSASTAGRTKRALRDGHDPPAAPRHPPGTRGDQPMPGTDGEAAPAPVTRV
jgi:hypothetical protein